LFQEISKMHDNALHCHYSEVETQLGPKKVTLAVSKIIIMN